MRQGSLKFNNMHTQTQRGIGMVEAVVVISIVSVAFAAILSAVVFFLRGGLLAADNTQAMYLLEEGVEAVRFLRDESYSTNITPIIGAGVRYLDPNASGFTVTTTNTPVLGQFTRSIELTEVYRRTADDDIVPSTSGDPKAVDPGTARLEVAVTWAGGSLNTTTYIADLYEN